MPPLLNNLHEDSKPKGLPYRIEIPQQKTRMYHNYICLSHKAKKINLYRCNKTII
ncbi:hypothetical protein KSU1_B0564 [Candidatus Jettenia caeni]|uniref:Uncharacterized protein n=1 Tax=Candidatus Jettenia caeni TaxID=247490 RepID=I3II76_9BACT|nr:hypothetical protein KSU1_B0564 [Candidatus Jettenia caeni]